MQSLKITFLLAVVAASSALKAGELFKICKKSDPELAECIKSSINEFREKLVEGVPQLKLPQIDPLHIPEISLKQGSGAVSMDSTFTNVAVTGLRNFQVMSVQPDLKNDKLELKVDLPYLHTEGNYTINGKMIALPITGKGHTESNYTNIHIDSTVELGHKLQNDKKYLKVKDIKVNLSVRQAKIHMDNLFNGNKELGDSMNKFMSENWQMVFKEMKPVIEQTVGAIIKNNADKIFNKFTEDQLLPA